MLANEHASDRSRFYIAQFTHIALVKHFHKEMHWTRIQQEIAPVEPIIELLPAYVSQLYIAVSKGGRLTGM